MKSSNELSKIPIKNLYYMLCYAWGHLAEKGMANISRKDEKDIHHLLTRILIVKLRSLIKRGFYREYRTNEEELSLLRGKILFSDSVRSFSFHRGKMYCSYEDLDLNILHNQIIKTTLYHLLFVRDLEPKVFDEVKFLYNFLPDVNIIKLSPDVFKSIRIHRSNQHYKFVLQVCQFLYESLLIHENGNEASFTNFDRDEKRMPRVYEEFVRNFYKIEQSEYRVKRDKFHWDATGEDLSFLPMMETDISLENNREKWIIDTKYYQETLKGNRGTEKIISANLYQLFAYLSNYKDTSYPKKELKGMLLYPFAGKEVDLFYEIKGYPIKVCTVNLNQDWQQIHNRLLEIIH